MRYEKGIVNILAINCGSSSLKYKIIRMPQEDELVEGEAERVGGKTKGASLIRHRTLGREKIVKTTLEDHSMAFRKILGLLKDDFKENKDVSFQVIAHRYVHPGSFFSDTVKVNKRVLLKLKDTLGLAPIHNPTSYGLIKLCHEDFSRIAQFIVFDTSFHKTMPEELATYALPERLTKQYSLRKVGFHGISHKYVADEACKFLQKDIKTQRIISCHLGTGGSSVCAIENGKSINTSMGFTPLEGLIMNTRSGDVDLGVVLYIMFRGNITAQEAETILNKKSGILGIAKSFSDLRDVIDSLKESSQAKIALSMYIKRIKKYIGFYALLIKKPDILIFTDSVGVSIPLVRKGVCENMEIFGINLDKAKNEGYLGKVKDVALSGSQTKILVIPTNEELMIAREAYKGLKYGFSN